MDSPSVLIARWEAGVFERRSAVRYRPAQQILCRVRIVLGESKWLAPLADISTGGLSFISTHPLPRSTPLLVEVSVPPPGSARVLLACVRHASRRPSNDYVIGGSFPSALSPEQLHALLRADPVGGTP
jgi:hypothetical protein